MEWVETTGRTVEEAKDRALDQLGVAEDDAEFEVLDEPRPGLFGRMRGEARVRARVRPTQARQKVDRRKRRKVEAAADERPDAAPGEAPAAAATAGRERAPRNGAPRARTSGSSRSAVRSAPPTGEPDKERTVTTVSTDEVGAAARQFVEGLLSSFGLQGEVALVVDGDDIELQVQGADLGLLVGPRGTTLQAVQDLTRVAAQRRLGDHDTRLRVDVGGYRERRREALGRFALQVAEDVRTSGTARTLEPMSSADRKIVHDVLAGVEGIATRSEGEDPQRRVVIAPADA